nr:MAG TPA: hypothetical protein [Caudoviricetes sp.]
MRKCQALAELPDGSVQVIEFTASDKAVDALEKRGEDFPLIERFHDVLEAAGRVEDLFNSVLLEVL